LFLFFIGIPHGHTGHVRFLTFVETNNLNETIIGQQINKQQQLQQQIGINNRNSITSHLSNISISSNNNNINNNNHNNNINNNNNLNNINNNNINLNNNNNNNNINNNNIINSYNNIINNNNNINNILNNNNINNNNSNSSINNNINNNSKTTKLEQTNILIISGGDGYEDFRSSGSNSMSEVAGREDSTNHLLLWQV